MDSLDEWFVHKGVDLGIFVLKLELLLVPFEASTVLGVCVKLL